MIKRRRLLASMLVASLSWVLPHAALAKIDPLITRQQVIDIIERLISLMANTGLSAEAFTQSFSSIVDNDMALDVVSSYLLGQYSRSADRRERVIFTHLVRKYIT
ncbi:MAG: hypothetical protein AAF352_02310, partial [Pseudomonadota bacterium]